MKQKIIFAFVALLCMASCKTPVENIYFADTDNLALTQLAPLEYIAARPGDKLTIIVSSKDTKMTDMFNPTYLTKRLGTGNLFPTYAAMCLYTVDSDGYIDFPQLGRLNVNGLTRDQIEQLITNELISRGYLLDAQAVVNFEKLKVTLLGEVKTPGVYTLSRDGMTILDALSQAGDMTVNGNRNNVKVVRTEGDSKRTYVIDLNSAQSTMSSPAYYLQQDDVVYIEPNDKRKRQAIAGANDVLSTSFWISLSSLLTSVASLIINW